MTTLVRAAIAAVRDCADQMDAQATSLGEALATWPADEGLRATVTELSAALRDTSGRVTFELALLQAQLGEGRVNADAAVQALSNVDATMMGTLAGVADVMDRLESAAELDERNEPAFVRVIEAAAVMMQALEKARAATQALRAAAR